MTIVFVTATGTDVGKTFVTAALIRHLRATGRVVEALKPIASGFASASVAASDPGIILEALGRPATVEQIDAITPWRFAAPLSPDMAAARENRAIDFNTLVAFCRRPLVRPRDVLLIEGVGGVMVPLDERHTVLDWITALRVPLLLVAGSYLGTISHTLTALHVLAQRHLEIGAVVVSESVIPGAPLAETVAEIVRFSDSIDVVGLPRLPGNAHQHPAVVRIVELLNLPPA